MGGINLTKRYVVGFLFDSALQHVALIRKQPSRPEQQWQTGLLNGIGGGIEPQETDHWAMVREFKEETDLDTKEWKHYATMRGTGWVVGCYALAVDSMIGIRSMTQEQVSIFAVADVARESTVENLQWLIALAVDFLQDGKPTNVEIKYP